MYTFANIVVFALSNLPPPLPWASHAGMCCGLRFEAQDLNAKSLGQHFWRHSSSSLLFCLYRAEEVLDA